ENGADVSDAIQAMIDDNPNRTLFFPDGEYLISKPIVTPAAPSKSVDLRLSNYAVLKAAPDFRGAALVMLGGKDAANDTHTNGSNYSLTGGILDGAGIANGIEISGGRETAVREVSIKNTVIGLHILFGANSGSSDADISDVNIIGTNEPDSVGILCEGYDNTFTNMRIGAVTTGVCIKSAGNVLRNIHPLYYSDDFETYKDSVGFVDECGSNLYDYCYSDNFRVGFRTARDLRSFYDHCFAFWYSDRGGEEICFEAQGRFNSVVTGMRIGFSGATKNAVLKQDGFGTGMIENLTVDAAAAGHNLTYKLYMTDNLLGLIRLRIVQILVFFKMLRI
ncbi:MAG: hypothetical protein IKD72_00670, partial [Clostridia bacterium]|nr:hypothetical protein [Clostridia bacterium]